MDQHSKYTKANLRFFSIAGGVLLILCGAAALPLHRLDLDATLILFTGVSLLTMGAWIKRTPLIIAGCLLGGAGLGILMYAEPWNIPAENQKALFIFCFAFGWFLIPLFTGLFTTKTRWFALIPGALIAFLAGAVLATQDRISWIVQAFLFNRSLSSLIVSTDLILIGLALTIPWKAIHPSR